METRAPPSRHHGARSRRAYRKARWIDGAADVEPFVGFVRSDAASGRTFSANTWRLPSTRRPKVRIAQRYLRWVRGRTRNPKGEHGARKQDCSHSEHRTWLSRACGSMCM